MSTARVSVNLEQAHRMAERFVELGWYTRKQARVHYNPLPSDNHERMIEYYFFTSMLLFDFKGLEATMPDGRYMKGNNVFDHLASGAFKRNPDFWTAASLARTSDDEFNAVFSLSGDAAAPTVSRMPERIEVLRDAAKVLNEQWGGSVLRLIETHPHLADDPVSGREGLLSVVLRSFKGFDDPIFKKFAVFLKALAMSDIWHAADPESIPFPVDYHDQRMALRNGVISVHDAGLAQKLRAQEPISQEDAAEVRGKVLDACMEMVRHSGLNINHVDDIYWLVGRSCCHYGRPPRCTTCDYTDCSVQAPYDYACPGKCPLATHCLGAKDDAYRSLMEPNIVTQYY
ncbi:MAG: hypothetical protein IT326_02495 [Anaerolineae bacterium]|nr:hypothetical protein [Anaerolineae bacterium]